MKLTKTQLKQLIKEEIKKKDETKLCFLLVESSTLGFFTVMGIVF